jgi:hypothetical protein
LYLALERQHPLHAVALLQPLEVTALVEAAEVQAEQDCSAKALVEIDVHGGERAEKPGSAREPLLANLEIPKQLDGRQALTLASETRKVAIALRTVVRRQVGMNAGRPDAAPSSGH